MKKLRNIIRWITPYGIVSSYIEKNYHRRHDFIRAFKQYVESGNVCELCEDNPYETIVSVQGFGYSGSGAIVDLLREYDTTRVIGFVDHEGSSSSREEKCEEVDILRLAGGLFEVEKYIGTNNIYQNDAMLHRVVSQIESSAIYRNNPSVRGYCYEYMRCICEVLTDSPQHQEYNTYLNYHGSNDILFLKKMSIIQYRNLCRRLLNSIFSLTRQETNDKSIIVLDQLVNDWEFDVERYRDYIPNLKIIMVYRDPRDVYTFAKLRNIGWIPHGTADYFVRWYNILLSHFDITKKNDYCVVQFESLITDYDRKVNEIESYVGLNPTSHIKKGICLSLTKSYKNINLWRNNRGLQADYEIIYDHLKQLCFETK